jgi:predicted  nucleic acid-binding Zn-ribbon protein
LIGPYHRETRQNNNNMNGETEDEAGTSATSSGYGGKVDKRPRSGSDALPPTPPKRKAASNAEHVIAKHAKEILAMPKQFSHVIISKAPYVEALGHVLTLEDTQAALHKWCEMAEAAAKASETAVRLDKELNTMTRSELTPAILLQILVLQERIRFLEEALKNSQDDAAKSTEQVRLNQRMHELSKKVEEERATLAKEREAFQKERDAFQKERDEAAEQLSNAMANMVAKMRGK